MLKETLKTKKAGGVLVKICDSMALPIIAKGAGMDFLFFDHEHGLIPYDRLHDLILMGNAEGIPSVVRAAQLARRDVSQALDCGAEGIMVPMVETKEQAEQLVSWSKYPPIGRRSYSGGANTHYCGSGHHEQNMKELNDKTLTIVQIETVKGVENIEEILSVPGVDAAIIGPCDLGISMDNPDNVLDERELAMIQKVADSARKHNKHFGIIGGMSLIEKFPETDLMIAAIDSHVLQDGLKQAVKEYERMDTHEQ